MTPTLTPSSSEAPARSQAALLNDEVVYGLRIAGKLPKLKRRPRVIDLFAGAGGLTLGFSKAVGHDFQMVWANDFDQPSVDTFNANFGDHCTYGDIVDILEDPNFDVPEADVVIGGPPCQGFSLLNKNRAGDPRRELWRAYMEVVKRSNATVFVMENVPQILGTPEHKAILEEADHQGFEAQSAKLCAAHYGAPQVRWRAVIIGTKKTAPDATLHPKRTHLFDGIGSRATYEDGIGYVSVPEPVRTVRSVIEDLPKPVGTEIRDEEGPLDLHFGRNPTEMSANRYRAIPKEGMNRVDLLKRAPELTPQCWVNKSGGTDLFGRLWWDRPSVTIRTEFFKPEKGRYLHPKQHRPITHREAARIQTFPDSFKFRGSKIDIAKQIGNAVSVVFAARIADAVYAVLVAE